MGVEQSMGQAFHEGTQAVEEDHEAVGTGEPVHVHQEVPGQLPVPAVVQRIADEGSEHHQEEHRDCQHQEPLGRVAEAEGDAQRPEPQEGEVLDVALEGQLQQHCPEGVRPQEEAGPMVEQQVEQAVAQEHEHQQSREAEHEEVHSAAHEHVVVPGFFHVPLVRVGVVQLHLLHRLLHTLLQLAQPHQLPLLFLHQLDDVQYLSDDAIIFLLMVGVQPQVVDGEEGELEVAPFDEVEEEAGLDDKSQGRARDHAFACLVPPIQARALIAVSPSSVTSLAFPAAVFLANPICNHHISHTICRLGVAHTTDQHKTIDTTDTVVGHVAGNALFWASISDC